ncbi:type VII secretion EssA family protein [Bacillus massilinigeriensis]|uniref:type VII secretion EssA family protein n=1 Tax=Bacillus mediterraneensis TaxID=1805474 RepID=UPI0008F8072C|nr:type VII secretion EssA family protein [Bacillus mediterraneensis]
MKRNYTFTLLLFFVFLMLSPALTARAEPGIEDLTPNEYKKREFKKNTDLLHEKSLTEKAVKRPGLQPGLDLVEPGGDSYEDVLASLFTGSAKENNSIAAKAKQLRLFSKDGREALAEGRDKIRDEQMKIVFSLKPNEDPHKEVRKTLFVDDGLENNMIAAKAKELKLFSGDQAMLLFAEEEKEKAGLGNKGVIITISVILLLLIIVLFALLIPKMIPEETKK